MTISICMATYNGEKYIKEQLDSILFQLGSEDELIISDDSSSDSTIEIIKSYKDERIKVYENQKFKSPIFNFENVLKHVRGDIVVLSDQDDLWESDKLEVIRKSFAIENSQIALKMYNGRCIDGKGDIIEDSLFKYLNVRDGLLQNIFKNSFIGCNIAFTKKLLDVSLPFPNTIPMHDMWLGCNAYIYGSVEFVESKVFNYRVHSQNYSIRDTSFLQKLYWRYSLVLNLLKGI